MRRSTMVRTTPAMCNLGLRAFLTRSTVLRSAPMPSSARNSACRGTSTASTATRAFSVTRPSDGGQSTRTVSQRSRALLPSAESASSSRCSRRSTSISSISAPASWTLAGMTDRPGIWVSRTAWSSVASPTRNSYEPGVRSLRPTPRPVEALPWGSKSISKTLSPTAARAVARLIAVVVFPTPPFWLAIAKTLGAVLADPEEDGVTIGHAGERLGFKVPVLFGCSDLSLPAFPFVEKANSGIASVLGGPAQYLTQRSQGPGGHHVGLGRRCGLDPGNHDLRLLLQGHPAAGLGEEGALADVRFDQRHFELRSHRRQNQPGEPAAAAKVGQGLGGFRDQGDELGRIEDMADPDVLQGGLA